MHLHAPGFTIDARDVLKLVDIEICPEFSIDAGEQVQIERRGDSQTVVIGGG